MLAPGTIVAGYRIDGTLGEGGMGTVYRATQLTLNRVVALKLLASELSDDPGFRTRFQREGQLQAALDNLNIVTVYEAGQADQGLFLAMQLISGPTLKELIDDGRLDPRRSLRLLMQVAQALDAAHGAGVTHRDVKPQNILVGERDHAYLADFGLTNPAGADRLTGTGQFIGTIDYVSPEQIRGEDSTPASDIYMLAGVMYECLTGRLPYARPTEAATLAAHLSGPPPRVTDERPDLPAELDDVIATGLAKSPQQRPESAAGLVLAATRCLAPSFPAEPQAPSGESIAPGGERGATRTRPAQMPAMDAAATALASSSPGPAGAAATAGAAAAGAASAATSGVPAAATAGIPAGATVAAAAGTAPAPGPAGAAARSGAIGRPSKVSTGGSEATATRPARGGAVVLAIVALLALAVIAAGYLAGHSGSSTTSATFSNSASAGSVELSYPSGWSRSSAAAPVPGLTFSQPMTLNEAGSAPGTLTAGMVNGSGATLLPASFRALVQGTPPSPNDPVTIGNLQAYRYRGLQVKGLSHPVTVYAVPTSAGVATLACSATTPTGGFLSQCARVVGTLRLPGVTVYALGPNPAYAKSLAATLSTLSSATSGPAARLRSASSPSAQASAATALAAAYQTASGDLARTAVDPASRDANTALSTALADLATGYTKAATAARANDSAAYSSAGGEITRASAAMTTALSDLRALGYSVQT